MIEKNEPILINREGDWEMREMIEHKQQIPLQGWAEAFYIGRVVG